jgi:dihydrofolate reductase
MISLVLAVSRNGVIGKDGDLPWRIPSDLKRFKAVTLGKPVIMGRKTWDSLPRKPLPGRLNIVLTRQQRLVIDGATVVSTPEAALAACANAPEICVIGGGEIFAMFMRDATRIYRTLVNEDVAGDTRFDGFDAADWIVTTSEHVPRGPGDSASFEFQQLDRKT